MNISPVSSGAPFSQPTAVPADASGQDVRQAVAAQASSAAPVVTQQAVSQTAKPEDLRKQLEDAAKAMNDFVKPINNSIEFSVDKDTGETVVKVVDIQTKDVIRQIPSEEMLAIAKAIDKVKGLLLHQKA